MSDDLNPNSVQIAEMISPSAYFDRSRFINTDVVWMLHMDEIGAFLISEVRVRDLSLDFSLAVSLLKSLMSFEQSKFDIGSHVATSKPLHLMRNLLSSHPAIYSTSYFFLVDVISFACVNWFDDLNRLDSQLCVLCSNG